MASKQWKLQQRNKHPRATSKVLAPPSQERSSDPWSFLECIDAPQWVDLSLEGSLMEKEGLDSWFDISHKHHVMSLAGLNTDMSWLCLWKLGPDMKTSFATGCQRVLNKPGKKQIAGHVNKLCNGQSQSLRQATELRVHKGEQDSINTERGCNAHQLRGSVKMGCSFSGSSSTCEREPSGSLKKGNLYSDRSSVSSSLQVCSVESKKSSLTVHKGSSDVNLSEDFQDEPSSSSGGTQKSRNSSSASYCPPSLMARYSSEVGFSTCTKSSEFWVSTVTKSQFACEADRQSSGDSVVTSVSGVSNTSEGQVGKGCTRASEEGTDVTRKTSELKVDGDYNPPSTGADCSIFNKNSSSCRQMANETLKSAVKTGKPRLERGVSQVGSLLRKQLHTGKENARPKGSSAAANLLQEKDKPFRTKAPLAFASSETANARPDGLSLGRGRDASQVSKKEGSWCASQVKPWKSGVSQNQDRGCASSIDHQSKRCKAKQLPVVYEKAGNSERGLAALVAQHNQKIRSLQLLDCRKGLR